MAIFCKQISIRIFPKNLHLAPQKGHPSSPTRTMGPATVLEGWLAGPGPKKHPATAT